MSVSFQDMYKMSSAASENAYQGSQNITIEQILSQARNSGDPRVMQQSIDKILSKVDPSRQPQAIQAIKGMISDIAAKEAGFTPGLDPNLQKIQMENLKKAQQEQQEAEHFAIAQSIPWNNLDENQASAFLNIPWLADAAKNRLSSIKEEKKQYHTKQEKLSSLYNASNIVNRLEAIIKENSSAIGIGASKYNRFGYALEARQEMETLGNTLLQIAMPFAIRNEKEFQTAKESLTNPASSVDSNIGAIKALRRIINSNIQSIIKGESETEESEGESESDESGKGKTKDIVDQETVNKIFR